MDVANATNEEVEYRITPVDGGGGVAGLQGGNVTSAFPGIDESWMRRQLASDLLRAMVVNVEWMNSEEVASKAKNDLIALAEAALAAAKVIYPEAEELPMTTEGGE